MHHSNSIVRSFAQNEAMKFYSVGTYLGRVETKAVLDVWVLRCEVEGQAAKLFSLVAEGFGGVCRFELFAFSGQQFCKNTLHSRIRKDSAAK